MLHLWCIPAIATAAAVIVTMVIVYIVLKQCHWTKENMMKSLDTADYLAWQSGVHQLANDIILEDLTSRAAHDRELSITRLQVPVSSEFGTASGHDRAELMMETDHGARVAGRVHFQYPIPHPVAPDTAKKGGYSA